MMLRIYTLIALFVLVYTVSSAQSYTSKIIPFHGNPNASNIELHPDGFIINSLNQIEGETGSSLVHLDASLDVLERIDFKNIRFSRDSPLWYSDSFWAFGQSANNDIRFYFYKLGQGLDVIWSDSINYFLEDGGISTMTIYKDTLYGGIWDRGDCSPLCSFMHFKSLDLSSREIISDYDIDDNERYYFSRQISSADQVLLSGGNLFRTNSNAAVYKINPHGDIIWKYVSHQKQTRGNVPVYVAELANGDIVYTDKIERDDLWPEYNDRPVRVGWLNSEGDSIRELVRLVPRNDAIEIYGVKSGFSKEYFFYWGETQNGDDDPGFIIKVDQDGNVVWDRKYRHSDRLSSKHVIRDIEELPNGDLIILGNIINVGTDPVLELWMMRLDSDGCFGTSDCGEEVIYTSTASIDLVTDLQITPNPSSSTIEISYADLYKVATLSITDSQGKLVRSIDEVKDKIDIRRLESGVYMLSLVHKDGSISTKRFVKI